ncbi:MAG: hypothetical protein RL095_3377 [Verrucomicrobiota bacterium]|jgi:putative transport protein
MSWLSELPQSQPSAYAIGLVALVCVSGMALGGLKIRGIGLGTAGVLFAGLILGRFCQPVDHHTLEFLKEFGLVFFVFTIGMQLGPGFFAAWRKDGLRLNLLAVAIVIFGSVFAVILGRALQIPEPAILGLLSGAVTNTPSLGAAQQALAASPGIPPESLALPAQAYAICYPAAICGIIGSLLALQLILRIRPQEEAEAVAAKARSLQRPLERRTLKVMNPNLDGLRLGDLPGRQESGVSFSRIHHKDAAHSVLALDSSVLRRGDALLAVGSAEGLDRIQVVVGSRSHEDLVHQPGPLLSRRVSVTNAAVLGKSLAELGLGERFGVAVTRVLRADLEMVAVPGLQIQFGDVVQLVGDEESLQHAAGHLGNSVKALTELHFVPVFIGVALGVALGTLPILLPGLPAPLKLGLAAGPLIVALLLARLGHFGRLVWHMPGNINLAFREFGIALFFAAVGLLAGPKFFAVAFSTEGLTWLVAGLLVTVVPLLLGGLFGRLVMRLDFPRLSGLLAGAMTDPPALAFASKVCRSELPSLAYATVYPVTMLLRIVGIQVLALWLM